MSYKYEFKSPKIIELQKKRLSGIRTQMLSIAEIIRVSVIKNFETVGMRLGKKWQRLAPATIKQKQKKKLLAG